MTRHTILILALVPAMALLSVGASAQEPTVTMDMGQYTALQDSLKNLRAAAEKHSAEIARLRAENAAILRSLAASRDSVASAASQAEQLAFANEGMRTATQRVLEMKKDSAKMARQIESLQKQVDKAKVKEKDAKISELEAEVKDLRSKMASADKDKAAAVSGLEKKVASLEKKLDDMAEFRPVFIKETVKRNTPYLDKPYAEMDVDYIEEVIRDCSAITDEPTVVDLRGRFEDLLGRKRTYDALQAVVQEFSNSTAVDKAKASLDSLKGVSAAAQAPGLDDLQTALDSYPVAAGGMKWLVERITKKLEGNYRYDTANFGEAMVRNALGDAEEEFGTQRAVTYMESIAKVPYMQRLFDQYRKELTDNPLVAGEAEKTILGMEY